MNRKGFTLIELLAVIVIMAIVLVIAFTTGIESYKESKLKSEDTFVKRISQVVDEYTSLNIDALNFVKYQNSGMKPGDTRIINIYKTTITINDLINQKLIKNSAYINPNNKENQCSTDAEIEIYRDSDFVYCHKIKAQNLDCLTDDYIEYINEELSHKKENNEYIFDENPYIINTCVWEEVSTIEESGD